MSKNILVVDDSIAIRQSLGFILKQIGYEVSLAQDGVEATRILETAAMDLVISDINMPNMDGIALTRHIRQSAHHKFTPVLVLTTESQMDKMQEGKAAGATGWIVKPFEADKFLEAIRKLLG